jgi:hypothetical protein
MSSLPVMSESSAAFCCATRDLEIVPVDGLQAALELPLQAADVDRNTARILLHAQLVARPHATTTPCSC